MRSRPERVFRAPASSSVSSCYCRVYPVLLIICYCEVRLLALEAYFVRLLKGGQPSFYLPPLLARAQALAQFAIQVLYQLVVWK
jgi:hypothetical protein